MKVSRELEQKILDLARVEAAPIVETVSEKDFQRAVIEEAIANGWVYFHVYDARKSVAGFPDLVLARLHRLIVAELKTETGQLSASQLSWGELLRGIGGNVEYRVWRPSDFPAIKATLEGK